LERGVGCGSGGKKVVDELTSSFLSEFLFILHVTTSTPVSDGLSGNMDRVDGSVDSNSREEGHLILRTRMWFYPSVLYGIHLGDMFHHPPEDLMQNV
jgi:hypothetical protein